MLSSQPLGYLFFRVNRLGFSLLICFFEGQSTSEENGAFQTVVYLWIGDKKFAGRAGGEHEGGVSAGL